LLKIKHLIKISTIVQEQIEASPFLSEALQDGLINVSALARRIQPEIEQRIGRPVKESTIIMAIKRLPAGDMVNLEKGLKQFFGKLSDIGVRSNLVDYTFQNSGKLFDGLSDLIHLIRSDYANSFYSVSQGVSETTVIVTSALQDEMERLFKKENLLSKRENLSAITLMLPKENRQLYGVYYYILRELAWKGINLVELISTSNEFTVIVSNQDLNQAFSVLSDLRKR
jgi:aspartokinase